MANRLAGNPQIDGERREAYRGGPPVLLEDELAAPLRLRKPAVIGVQFMGDLFHESLILNGVPSEALTAVMVAISNTRCRHHTFVVLTKRPRAMLGYVEGVSGFMGPGEEYPPPNLILGVSVEDRQTADERVPLLLQTPAARRIVSYEPAIGAVDFDPYLGRVARKCSACGLKWGHDPLVGGTGCHGVDGIICGPETGPGARPMDIDWARQTRDQCAAAGVAFWYKPGELDGATHKELP
jgi:protein gp37